MSENDEGFEVTMTATADADLSEDGVAQIQVLFFCFSFLIASTPLNFRVPLNQPDRSYFIDALRHTKPHSKM